MSDSRIVIITDSSAYIPESAQVGLSNIRVIPLWLLWEGENLKDGVDILPSAFYARLRSAHVLPTSSQPTVVEFADFFQQVAKDADSIISVLVSSVISGTVENAQKAVEGLPDLDIHIVDSKSSSMGLGHIVLAAARAAAEGKSVKDVIAAAEDMRDKIELIFVVDTLEYLHKGGRIGGAKRLMGTALRVKPLLEFRDGQVEPVEQIRTKHKAYTRLLEIAAERLAGRPMAEATVVDVDSPEDGDWIAQKVVDRFNPGVIHRAEVSPVVGTHVGPGTVGLAFYAQD